MSKTALITGASTGIGYELSKVFAQNKHNLVLVARSEEKLNEVALELNKLYGVEAHTIAIDLSRREAPWKIFEELQQKKIDVEFLVNNAGFGLGGSFMNTELETEVNMMDLNMIALAQMSKLFGAEMVKRKSGRIMNVSSTAAFQPGPFMNIYYATKAFVQSFTEALAFELKGTGVSVTALCPGATVSEFQNRAEIQDIKLVKMHPFGLMKADVCAKKAYKGMMKGKRIVITGFRNRMGVQSVRTSPRALVTWLTGKINR